MRDDFDCQIQSDELADCETYAEWCLLRDASRIASQEADLWDREIAGSFRLKDQFGADLFTTTGAGKPVPIFKGFDHENQSHVHRSI